MADEKKVLIVEDDPDIRKVLSMRLEINGFSVVEAEDGQQGLDMVKSKKPELIIMDLMMPKMDGFETCRMIRFDDEIKDIPIIVLSALNEESERKKAFEAGADAYFIKPFDLDLLLNKIKDLIAA
jgi:DNA-binding response OmpR family regulator